LALKVVLLGLGLEAQVLGLGYGLEGQVLGLGFEGQVLGLVPKSLLPSLVMMHKPIERWPVSIFNISKFWECLFQVASH